MNQEDLKDLIDDAIWDALYSINRVQLLVDMVRCNRPGAIELLKKFHEDMNIPLGGPNKEIRQFLCTSEFDNMTQDKLDFKLNLAKDSLYSAYAEDDWLKPVPKHWLILRKIYRKFKKILTTSWKFVSIKNRRS